MVPETMSSIFECFFCTFWFNLEIPKWLVDVSEKDEFEFKTLLVLI